MQGGTNVLTAFVQQGSQIAGAFGPVGAAIGAVGAVVGGLAGAFLNAGDEAETFAGKIDGVTESIRRLTAEREKAAQVLRQQASAAAGADPIFTGGRLQTSNIDELEQAAETSLGRDTGDRSSPGIRIDQLRVAAQLRRENLDLEKAIQNFESKPPFENSDEYRAAQAEAKKLNDERERSAKAAQRENEQRARLIQQLEAQVDATKRLSEATGEGAYATKLSEIENENQRRILQASQTLTGKQLEQAKALSNEIAKLERRRASVETALPTGKSTDMNSLRRQAEQEGFDQAGNPLPIDKNKALDETREFTRIQQDILVEPWRELAVEVSGITTGIFEDFLNKGKISGDALGESLTQSVNRSLAGLASNLATAPLQKAIAEIGSGQYSGIIDFAKKNPALTAATGGIMAGQIGGQMLGLEGKYSGLGGIAGAGAGFLIGNLIVPGIGGIIGAGIGGFAGSIGGGMFGAENNLGNDRSSQTYSGSLGEIVYSDKSFSQGNRNITSGIIGEIQTIQEALGDLGATFGDFNLRIEAGNKSGITVNGKKYDTAEDALKGAIEELLTSRTGGLNATQETILANTKGGSAAEIGQDLAFGQTYDRLIQGGNSFDIALKDLDEAFRAATIEATKLGLSTDALAAAHQREAAEVQRQRDQATRGVYEQIAIARGDNSLGTQLHILETQMRELAKAAAELGIPLEYVTDAHQRAANELVRQRDQATRGFYEQNAALRGDTSLGTQLHILETQMRELAKAAADLGVPLEVVTETHRIAAERIIEAHRELLADTEQNLLGANRNAFGAIDQFLDPIKQALGPFGIGQGVYSPQATAQGGLEQFREVLAQAQAGDTGALSSIVGIGQQTLQAARAYGASGAEFQAIFREVNKGLLETQGQLEERRLQLVQQGLDYQKETLSELIRLRVEQVNELKELREQLRRDLALATERRAA